MYYVPLLLAQEAASSTAISTEFFSGIDGEERFVVILTAIGCTTAVLISVTAIISNVVGSIHRRNAEYDLKRDLLDRGMSAEEISKVLQAAPLEKGVESWIATWGKCGKVRKKA